jgi:hypothetical protein
MSSPAHNLSLNRDGLCEAFGSTMPLLADRFPAAMDSLAALFGRGFLAERADRLEEIFAVTEQAWERNLSRLEGVPIRYLLIAEAAPWTDAGNRPSYSHAILGGSWVGRVLQAFDVSERGDALAKLAQRGFLLADTLPPRGDRGDVLDRSALAPQAQPRRYWDVRFTTANRSPVRREAPPSQVRSASEGESRLPFGQALR